MVPIRQQNPFSFYDFLGYLIPGAVLLLGIGWLYYFYLANDFFQSFSCLFGFLNSKGASFYLVFVILSYISGHIVGYLSSISIELFHNRYHGYPSDYLMNKDERRTLSQFLCYGSLVQGNPIQRNCSCFLRFRWCLFFVSLLPISLLEFVFGTVFRLNKHYTRKASDLVLNMLERKAGNFFRNYKFDSEGRGVNWEEFDYIRVLYHFSLEKSNSHPAKMQNYVAIYGFLRNLSFCFLLFSWVLIFYFIYYVEFFIMAYVFCFSSASFVLYLSFIKFYRRFSLESIMAFLSVDNKFLSSMEDS